MGWVEEENVVKEKNVDLVIKRTGILLYRRNLNKAKFYTRMKKITLI